MYFITITSGYIYTYIVLHLSIFVNRDLLNYISLEKNKIKLFFFTEKKVFFYQLKIEPLELKKLSFRRTGPFMCLFKSIVFMLKSVLAILCLLTENPFLKSNV